MPDNSVIVYGQLDGVSVLVNPFVPFGVPPPQIFKKGGHMAVAYFLLTGNLLHTDNPENDKTP